MTSKILPTTQNTAAAPAKPLTPKREFERILREIRTLFAQSRIQSGDLINELIKQTESCAGSQKWSMRLSVALLVAGNLAGGLLGSRSGKTIEGFSIGGKIGEGGQLLCNAQMKDQEAAQQKNQQALGSYNTFDSRMQAVIQSINGFLQNLRQQENDAAMNR